MWSAIHSPTRPYAERMPTALAKLAKFRFLLPRRSRKRSGQIRCAPSSRIPWPSAILTRAHLHCPPLLAALAAEVVISALNQSMDSFDQAPIATIVEQKLIRWLCGEAGYPAGADGTFTTGGSQSNYMGLLLARDAFL